VRALALDRQIEERFLEALRADQVTLALSALAHLEQEEQARSAGSGSSVWSALETSPGGLSGNTRPWNPKIG
jgi:hypothetical protein